MSSANRGPRRRAGTGPVAVLAGTLLLGLAGCTGDVTPVPPAPSLPTAGVTPSAAAPTAPAATSTLPATALATETPPAPSTLVPAPPAGTATLVPAPTNSRISPTEVLAATATAHPPTAEPVQAAATPVPVTSTRVRPASPTTTRTPPAAPTSSAVRTPRAAGSPQIVALATGFGNPDDLTVGPDGTIYFGDFTNTAINRLPPGGGTAVPVATGLREPEGIAVTADGRLIVEEQKTNRIWDIDPRDGSRRLVRTLENTTGQDGVDGLAMDPSTGDILVPDSPNGRLLSLSRDGTRLRTLASGFTRPTGVAVLPGGDLLVADEFGNTLYRVNAAGRKSVVATMYQPDDVVLDAAGIAYVNSLNGNIYRVDPATGSRTTLLTGLKLPHGLSVDPGGNLVIAEAGRNRIFRLLLSSAP